MTFGKKCRFIAILCAVTVFALGTVSALGQDLPQRDPRFLQPGEVADWAPDSAPAEGSYAGRDTRYLLPEEMQALPDPTGMLSAGPNGHGGLLYSVNFGSGVLRIANCKEWVNLRADPSTKNPPIGKALLGDAVTVLSRNGKGDWSYIAIGGIKGWVLSKFIVRK